jgi:hypothetical protein
MKTYWAYKDVGMIANVELQQMDANYLYMGLQNDKKYIFDVITVRKRRGTRQ